MILPPNGIFVPANEDRFGEHRGLGISHIDIKIAPTDTNDVLVIENVFHAKGGPPQHLHVDQDELFYALEGEFIVEVGDVRFTMRPGDTLLAPQMIPHVWAHIGDSTGRMLISFFPAGKMVDFFKAVNVTNAMPGRDPALWKAHGMELLGAPLSFE